MTFKRSPSALYSLHVFFGVDAIVYCEGGPSLSYQDAIKATNTDGTLDSLYWSSVVELYKVKKKFHFKSAGSKTTLKKILEDVNNNDIDTVIVCMDSDYDLILGRSDISGRVAWTMGYSWENDAVQLPVVEGVIIQLAGQGRATVNLLKSFEILSKKLQNDLLRWTEIDIALCNLGKTSVFDRSSPLSSIETDAPPNVKHNFLQCRLSHVGYRRGPNRVVKLKKTDVFTRCYGKMISKIFHYTLSKLLKKHHNFTISYDIFMRLAINEVVRATEKGLLPSFYDHVQSQKSSFI